MRSKGFFRKFALALHRSQEESRRLADAESIRAKYALFGGFVFCATLLFLPIALEVINDWDSAKLSVPFSGADWKVAYANATGPCPLDVSRAAECPASPLSPVLWKSAHSRGDKDHISRVQNYHGREFWEGIEIPPAALKKAAIARANFFQLGWLRATYHVWVDDKLLVSGDKTLLEPLGIPIPLSRLNENRPLRIALQIFHVSGHPYPDFFNSGLIGEGFITMRNNNSYIGMVTYIGRVRMAAVCLANLVIAAMFLMFWSSAKSKQEYFYMAVFGLLSAFAHIPWIDYFNTKISTETVYSIAIFMEFTQSAFAMFLGLSFARTRIAIFRWGLPLAIIAPLAILTGLNGPMPKFLFKGLITKWATPIFCSIGALTCLVQAYHLFSERTRGSYLPVRIQRLIVFAACLFGLAAVAWINSSWVLSATKHVYWFRLVNLTLAYLLGVIVFNEYRDREKEAEKTPVSEYHRRPVLPEKVAGAILVADLKTSEPFYRHRAAHRTSENIVTIWRTHFYTSIMKFNGTIIHKKGDEVIGFFDQDKSKFPLVDAIKAIEDMSRVSLLLENEFKNQQIYPPDAQGLYFRAAATLGEIRPVWEMLGNVREAYWEEAGSSSPFVESSRLLEMERKFGTPRDTLLVLSERHVADVADADPRLVLGFKHRDQPAKDKHGQEYRVAIFDPALRELSKKKVA
jgi:hypothetical protein